MSTVVIVGSGPSGVHLAETLLRLGHAVTMLDVGRTRPNTVAPEADFAGLKETLDDPVEYFLGADGRGVMLPDGRDRYFSQPPSKDYVFAGRAEHGTRAHNFDPVMSFAAGGLSEAWTAGSYALNDAELADFPLEPRTLQAHYATIARRIGVAARRDDLARFTPWLDDYQEPVEADPHARHLLSRYEHRRADLNSRLGFYLGRSRVAMITRDHGDRRACTQLGRCFWGCPRDSIYSASSTLRELKKHPLFRYVGNRYVTHFTYEGAAVTGFVANAQGARVEHFRGDVYALAAGTLCSSKIFLDSLYRGSGTVFELKGLLDNAQAIVPFVSVGRLALPVSTHAYQLHQLALGIEQQRPEEYVHGQITTLKSASIHPIVQSLPFDLKTAAQVFRAAHAALGAANVWLHDRRDDENVVTIRPREDGPATDLVFHCAAPSAGRFRHPLHAVTRGLRALGCFIPPGMTKVLPRGSSIHYAGTLPMNRAPRPFTCSPTCRSHDFGNLYFADGVSFPFLPAKNITFTLMANAVRVAEAVHHEARGLAPRIAER
jgi:choline dehydrogenase-like flavoprotein